MSENESGHPAVRLGPVQAAASPEGRVVVREVVRPEFFWGVSALDVGFVDRTFYVGGYVDYVEGVLVVEAEASLGRATTREIADAVEGRERWQWGDRRTAGGRRQPYVRVSDVDHRLIADLRVQHDLEFRAVERKNFDADINLVNVLIRNRQLLVSEGCPELRRQLREGVYARNRKDMARDAGGGHYDGLAALRYFCRVAEPLLRRDPYPEGVRPGRPDAWQSPREAQPREKAGVLPGTELGRKAATFAKRMWGRG